MKGRVAAHLALRVSRRVRENRTRRGPFSLSLSLSLYLSLSFTISHGLLWFSACKRKDEMANQAEHQQAAPKKPRLVFTDLQRRTLQAIFKVSTARAHTHTYSYLYAVDITSYPFVIDSNCVHRPLPDDMHRQMNIERALPTAADLPLVSD